MAGQVVDYYRLLGVDPSADHRAIRSAYRRLARRYHPDVAKGKHAARRFLLVQEAYGVLTDPEKRREYDRLIAQTSVAPRPAATRATASRRRTAAPAEPAAPRRGFRLVLDVLGILRLDTGIDLGDPASRTAPSSGRARARKRRQDT